MREEYLSLITLLLKNNIDKIDLLNILLNISNHQLKKKKYYL